MWTRSDLGSVWVRFGFGRVWVSGLKITMSRYASLWCYTAFQLDNLRHKKKWNAPCKNPAGGWGLKLCRGMVASPWYCQLDRFNEKKRWNVSCKNPAGAGDLNSTMACYATSWYRTRGQLDRLKPEEKKNVSCKNPAGGWGLKLDCGILCYSIVPYYGSTWHQHKTKLDE